MADVKTQIRTFNAAETFIQSQENESTILMIIDAFLFISLQV